MDRFLIAVIVAVLAVALPILNVGGEKCGTERYDCGYKASCSSDTDKCECDSGHNGFSLFLCGNPKNALCQIVGDPMGRSFASQPSHPVKFALPCKFTMAEYSVTKQRFQNGEEHFLWCGIKVMSAMKRIKGRMAVHGYEVTLSWSSVGGGDMDKNGEFSFRQTGTFKDGEYSYVSLTQDTSGGPWNEADFTQIQNDMGFSAGDMKWYEFEADDTYFSLFTVEPCALEIAFRPPNEDDAFDSQYMPGISISQYAGEDINYEIFMPAASFCHSAKPEDYNVTQAMQESGADVIGLYMTDTMDSVSLQDFPDVSQSCYDVFDKADWMKKERKPRFLAAEKSCRYIFQDPDFIRCYAVGADSDNLVALYSECLDVYYAPAIPPTECHQMKERIELAGCIQFSPIVCPEDLK